MRLWTMHPKYLDPRGLVALWRESLLAQKAISGETRGYRRHPQLKRFLEGADPKGLIASYLNEVYEESVKRGYSFNREKIGSRASGVIIEETEAQLLYEWEHFLSKVRIRDRACHERLMQIHRPDPHPLFTIVPGPVRDWEKVR